MKIKKQGFKTLISILLIISLFTSLPITAFAAGDNGVYALTYHVGMYDMFPEGDGSLSVTIDGTKYYYSDDYGNYDDISDSYSSMENQNVLYELHENKIVRVYSLDNVLTPEITVEPSIKEGLIFRNGKFSQNSFDLVVKVSNSLKSNFQGNELLWLLNDTEKDRLYVTLKKLEIEPSGGVNFGSSGWWLWKDYQTKISENLNDNVKVNETKEYRYTVNLQNDKVLNQKEYNIELYTTPTFDFGAGKRTTSKIKVGNLDYQEEKTEERKANSTSGKSVNQASTKLERVKSALQFSKNLLSSEQTNQINEYVNLWLSELILARYVDKSDIKQKVSEKIANEWLSKLGLDTSVLLVPGTIKATTYLKTQTKDGTKVFIELYINLTSFDFGNSGMPTMATGSGTATIYNMNGEKMDSSVIIPAYADVCAFCKQLQKVAKDTIFNGAKQYRTIFGIDTDATAEALSSQIIAKLLNNKYTKDVFKKVDAKDVKSALKKLISDGDKKCGNKIFELVTTPSQNSTLISVKCPVDVTVYDNDGNICGMVRNNVVDTLYSDVFINVVGDQKNIYLIGDDYTFTLSGTDSGTMDYVVTEFDESGNKTREITYSNIELSNGCKYYSYVPEAENHNSSLFGLTDREGNIISATTGMDYDFDVTDSGKCGDNAYWALYNDGTLYISGTRAMSNPYYREDVPWYYYRSIIKSVTISNDVTTIGDFAFIDCSNLESVKIGNSVTTIGNSAFSGCTSLTSITIPDSVTIFGNGAFEDCTNLTNIVIPENVTSIGYDAFCDCTSLTSISIPDKVTNIGIYTFSGCTNLMSVIIGNRVESISHRAFYNCQNLTNITIPDSVTSIDGEAFFGCTSKLCKINYKGTLDKWAEIKFKDYASNPLNYGNYLYINDELVTQARLTETKIINTWAFLRCKSLTSVIIGNSVASIGDCAFRDCTNLTNIIITDSVTSIGSSAFIGCTSLESLTIPNSVTSIGNDAFIGGKGLKSVMIPDSVIDIGECAFGYYIDDKNYSVVKMKGFTIKGYKGTAAETYANINGFEFVNLDGQNENTYIDSKTNISVTITGNAELSVKKLTDSESLNKANNTLGGSEKLVNLYNISLTKDGEPVQPDGTATLKIPCENKNAKIYRIEDNGTATNMNAVYDNGYMVFTTEHFSLYALVVPNDSVTGDVNDDGVINAKDRMLLTRYLAKWSGYEDINMTAADVNNDDVVNAKDRMILTRHLAKWQGYETLSIL
ncbi:leucine-rich repeat protein [Ruminococcus bromii]|uniref:leucine-rich repeat protein n=1 Tax=Ruminococcus bromii TaxID=40518 RepID=UPI0039F52B1F